MLLIVNLPTDLLIRVILGVALAGLALSMIGVFVVHLKITSIGFCMSHAAFAGAALGMLIQCYHSNFDPTIMSIIFTLLIAAILGPVSQKTRMDSNIILGILFSLMIALGFIFMALMPTSVVSSQAMGIMWGSIFGLRTIDFIMLIIINILIFITIILFYREFVALMFNKKLALASGIHVGFFNFLVLFLADFVVSFSLKIIGALLVYALIVNPTSTVHQFVYDTKKLFIYSPIVGVATSLLGVFLSLLLNWPIGSSVIVTSSVVFAISVLFSPKRRKPKLKPNNIFTKK